MVDSCAYRIAIFTHDAYGIGHVRRCINVIQSLAERAPQAAILFITGSPAVELFKVLPPNSDVLKIPTVSSSDASDAKPPTLAISFAELALLRRRLIKHALLTYEPDVFLVDNFPLGSQRELLPVLKELCQRSTRTILGMRDIADPPEKIKKDWSRDGMYEVLERYYDCILVYGMREVFDVADAYSLPESVASKIQYCGYVTSEANQVRTPEDVQKELGINGPFVLVTVGGGGDGLPIIRLFLQALPLISVPGVVITGPRMSSSDRSQVQSLARGCPGVRIMDYVPDLPSYINAARVVVSMAGYNTVAEILAQKCHSIIIPRTWYSGEHGKREVTRVDLEQHLRSKKMADLGLIDMLELKGLSPDRLAERINSALNGTAEKPKIDFNVNGLGCAVNHILGMVK